MRPTDPTPPGRVFLLGAGAAAVAAAIAGASSWFDAPNEAIYWGCLAAAAAFCLALNWAAGARKLSSAVAQGREATGPLAGMAISADLIGAGLLVGLTPAIVEHGFAPLGVIVGMAAGVLLGCHLIAPYVRRYGGWTATEFLGARYGSGARLFGVLAIMLSALALLTAELAAIGHVMGALGAPRESATIAAAVCLAIIALAAGFRAAPWAQATLYAAIAAAFLFPAAWMAATAMGAPIPHLAGFDAVPSAAPQFLSPAPPASALSYLAVALTAAFGVAASPQLLTRAVSSPSVRAARGRAGWAILFLLLILLAAPGLAAISAPFPEFPAFGDAPVWVMGLMLAAAAAAAASTSGALIFAVTGALSRDLSAEPPHRQSDPTMRVTIAKLVAAALVALAAFFALRTAADVFTLLVWGLAIAASGLFAPLMLGVFWSRTTASAAGLGACVGLAVSLAAILAHEFEAAFTVTGSWALLISAEPSLTAGVPGVLGVLASAATILVAAGLAPERNRARRRATEDFVETLRIPRGAPMAAE